jgi:hypothetical protein
VRGDAEQFHDSITMDLTWLLSKLSQLSR